MISTDCRPCLDEAEGTPASKAVCATVGCSIHDAPMGHCCGCCRCQDQLPDSA